MKFFRLGLWIAWIPIGFTHSVCSADSHWKSLTLPERQQRIESLIQGELRSDLYRLLWILDPRVIGQASVFTHLITMIQHQLIDPGSNKDLPELFIPKKGEIWDEKTIETFRFLGNQIGGDLNEKTLSPYIIVDATRPCPFLKNMGVNTRYFSTAAALGGGGICFHVQAMAQDKFEPEDVLAQTIEAYQYHYVPSWNGWAPGGFAKTFKPLARDYYDQNRIISTFASQKTQVASAALLNSDQQQLIQNHLQRALRLWVSLHASLEEDFGHTSLLATEARNSVFDAYIGLSRSIYNILSSAKDLNDCLILKDAIRDSQRNFLRFQNLEMMREDGFEESRGELLKSLGTINIELQKNFVRYAK